MQGAAPDIGAFEYGELPWSAGHRATRSISIRTVAGSSWQVLEPADRVLSDAVAGRQVLAIDRRRDAVLIPMADGDG